MVANARFTWANIALRTLEEQALIPLTHEHPLEMGVNRNERGILDRFRGDPRYVELFEAAFPAARDTITLENVVKAISSFERTLVSLESPYDRFLAGQTKALNAAARRGYDLFRSENLNCARCHAGRNFRMVAGHLTTDADHLMAYHNTGLYNVGGTGAYPGDSPGLIGSTGVPEDAGRFKAPTLRNIAVTSPYMHDGSVPTLDEVIDFYAAGGRLIASGSNAGDGRANPFKSPFITGFDITPEEKRDLIAFLESLTDRAFLTNPAFSNPFAETPLGQ